MEILFKKKSNYQKKRRKMQLRSGTRLNPRPAKEPKSNKHNETKEKEKKTPTKPKGPICGYCLETLKDDMEYEVPSGECPECKRRMCGDCSDEFWWPIANSGQCLKCCRLDYSKYPNGNDCEGEDDDRYDAAIQVLWERTRSSSPVLF